MNQRKNSSYFLFTFFTVLLTISLPMHGGVGTFFERLIFGSTIAQPDDQELCMEVKDFLDVTQDHQLYYMRWPWNYFCSFTQLSGTWIDKETWNDLDPEGKIFTMYHEISHKALGHPFKQYLLLLGTIALIAYCTNKYGSALIAGQMNKLFSASYSGYIANAAKAMIVGVTAVIISGISSRFNEQDANEKAIEALCIQDRVDIVEKQIECLEQVLEEQGNLTSIWFSSIKNQIDFFKKTLALYS